MARKLRVEFAGAIYHVMNRGDRRQEICWDDRDRERFLVTLAETCAKTGWQVHAFCLMPNHFHLVVETPQPNLVAGMHWFLGTYTSRFNHRHQFSGHLFSGRYKSLLVSGQGGYLRTVSAYVHLNPVRANLLPAEAPLRNWQWSSFPEYLKTPTQRADWMRVDRVLGDYGIPKDSAAGRREFEKTLEAQRGQEDEDALASIRHGWYMGDETFRQELLAQVSAKAGPQHYGAELAESAEAKAERIVTEELARHKWTAQDLASARKGDTTKVAIALRLRRETTMTLPWIAARLQMGTKTHLAHLLYWEERENGKRQHDTML
jgi:REP element-mobilizing transposase RayT